MDDPLFLMNGHRIGKESCPNPNDHSNFRRQFYGRVIALSRLFVYSKNERFSLDDRDTNERINTTQCTISRECIKRAKKNIFNDTKRMK